VVGMLSVEEPSPATRLGGEQSARPEASHGRRNSTPVISLDFSDAMCAVEVCGDDSLEIESGACTASGTIRALLVVFELSSPSEEDCAVSSSNLEKVLQRQLCSDSEDNSNTIVEILSSASTCSRTEDGRIDFFSYWQSMDMFFNERGLFSQADWQSHHPDVFGAARQLRDYVLATYNGAVSQESPIPELLTVVLEGCIDDECRRQDLVYAFQDHGMTLPQLGGMIYACLKKYYEASQGDDITLWDLEDRGAPQGGTSPARGRDSIASTPSLASPAQDSRRRGSSLASDSDEAHSIHELAEIVERSLNQKDKVAQKAIARIVQQFESLSLKNKQQQDLIYSMEADVTLLEKERCDLQAELLQAREVGEDAEEWKRECDRQRQRAAAFEKQLAETEEQNNSACQSLKRLELEHRETSRDHADCQRRYTQLREYCDRLELSSTTSEEKMKELELAAQHAERRSVQLTNELDKLSFHSNLAKVLQRRSSQLASVEEKPTDSESTDSRGKDTPTPAREGPGDTSSMSASSNGIDEMKADSSEVCMLKQQLAVQQAQLQSLRAVRNDIFNAQDSWSSEQNHSKLLVTQLRAMMQHTQKLESLLDSQNSSGMAAPTASHHQQRGSNIGFGANLADQLAAQIENDDEDEMEPCSPGVNSNDNKSPARESTVSTTVSSGRTFTRPSVGSESASSTSMRGDGEHAESFMLGGSGLQVEVSPKKKLVDNARSVMRLQRIGNAWKIQEESADRRKRNSHSPVKSSSRSRHSMAKSDSRTKAERQERDSWMPSLSGLVSVIAGPTAEESTEESTDEEEKSDRRRSRHTTHFSHKHRRSEITVRR